MKSLLHLDEFKKCGAHGNSGCKKTYPRSKKFFYADKNSSDGLKNYCKSCYGKVAEGERLRSDKVASYDGYYLNGDDGIYCL